MKRLLLIPLLILSLTVSAISAPIVMHYCEMNQKAQKAAKVQRDCCCKSVKKAVMHPKACSSRTKPAPSKPECCHDQEISPTIPSRLVYKTDVSVVVPLPALVSYFIQFSAWHQTVILPGRFSTDSSPPYLAAYNQITYLRNDLLLI